MIATTSTATASAAYLNGWVQVVIFAPAQLHSGSTALEAHGHGAAWRCSAVTALAVCDALINVGAAAHRKR
jgi:hypothetical protein